MLEEDRPDVVDGNVDGIGHTRDVQDTLHAEEKYLVS